MTGMSRAVFLSHASQDSEAAARICQALRVGGIEVWFDQSELRGGEAWDRQISKQIRECALFIALVSAHTDARPEGYFRREWRLAVDRTRDIADDQAFLLPVVVDGTPDATARVPEKFHEVHWTRLPGGETPPAFVERVARLLSNPPEPSGAGAPSASADPRSHAPAAAAPATAGSARRSKYLLLLIALGLLVGGYLAIDRWAPWKRAVEPAKSASPAVRPAAPPSSAIPEKSIAVLPFVDMSEKRDQEYFSDGLTEELIDHLAHVADLKVIARTSSFEFKGKNEDVRSIAARLGVAHVLEGSVRKSGRTLRITAQLIRAADGVHLWSQTYDRSLKDVFQVQDEIAGTVARALTAAFSQSAATAASRAKNIDAYNLLLRGNYVWNRSALGDNDKAIALYKQAIALDPNYAQAWAKLARVYAWQGNQGEISAAEARSKGWAAAQKSLAIDPDCAEGHYALGNILRFFEGDWAAANREYEKAFALDPQGDIGVAAQGNLLDQSASKSGRFAEWIDFVQRQLVRNPLDTDTLWALSGVQFNAGNLAESAAASRKLLELNPAYVGAHSDYALTLLRMGRFDEALAAAEQEADETGRQTALACIYWTTNRRAESDAALKKLENDLADRSAYSIGAIHAYRGELDAAFAWLDRAHRIRPGDMEFIKIDPLLQNLRGDPRYQALLRKSKLVD